MFPSDSSRLIVVFLQYATFHVFFPKAHFPPLGMAILNQTQLKDYSVNCDMYDPTSDSRLTYRTQNAMDYPVNVARNVARESAGTHFVFPSGTIPGDPSKRNPP